MDQTAHDTLRQKLKLRHFASKDGFAKNHPNAASFFSSINFDLGKVRQHSTKLLTAGIGGVLLLSATGAQAQDKLLPPQAQISSTLLVFDPLLTNDPRSWLVKQLGLILPPIKNPYSLPFLTLDSEKVIGKEIERATGVPAVATLESEHLNTTYGYIGAEQHLVRFPGDTLAKHDEAIQEGIAPGRGAWGWFTEGGKLTQDAYLREKYYVAVQTLYLPDWDRRLKYLSGWYKWRKIIVVDTDNGNAVVAVVGDAGPAAWTGKHFGGSPEVMNILGGPKYKKGRVLLFFVDDSENKIPLGKIDYNKFNIAPVVSALKNPVVQEQKGRI